jgi:hypothetical protein
MAEISHFSPKNRGLVCKPKSPDARKLETGGKDVSVEEDKGPS